MRNIDKKYHYLYKTINLINEKYYYGIHSTNDLNDSYLGSGKYLRNAIHRHGKDNFKREIIKQFDNREELVQAEIDLITKDLIQDKYCMNLQLGGEGFNTIGMCAVKDKDGNTFNVFCDDERYLSGELVSITVGKVAVKDKDGKHYLIDINDFRYLSGELVHVMTDSVPVKDKHGKTYNVSINDPMYLSGELVHVMKDTITVKDKHGKTLRVNIDDPRYISGELKHLWSGKTHTDETKKKMSESSKGKYTGKLNSQFGTCWITKDGANKKIKKELLQSFINDGWIKGRK